MTDADAEACWEELDVFVTTEKHCPQVSSPVGDRWFQGDDKLSIKWMSSEPAPAPVRALQMALNALTCAGFVTATIVLKRRSYLMMNVLTTRWISQLKKLKSPSQKFIYYTS